MTVGFSMSATLGDLDNDLDNDLYVSNMASTAANRVLAMPGDPTEDRRAGGDLGRIRAEMSKGNTVLLADGGALVDVSDASGARAASWAWGAALLDYDCDGDLDIHCLNGFWTVGQDDGRDL